MIGEFLEENENKNEKMLKDQLKKTWIELDKMLFCTKLPMCVIKSVHMHSKSKKTFYKVELYTVKVRDW